MTRGRRRPIRLELLPVRHIPPLPGLVEAATELRDSGTTTYLDRVAAARPTIRAAFQP